MKQKLSARWKTGIVILLLGLLTLLSLYPYLRNGLVYGDDYLYHLARIASLSADLSAGTFPVKIHQEMNMGYGYGTGFFYPDFFLYFPALLMSAGISLWNAWKCFAALLIFACAVSLYLCVRHLSHSRTASLLMAAAYLLSRPFLNDLYGRFAVGECLAFVFLPLVFCGAYNLFYENFDRPLLLGGGFLGLLLSHPVTLVAALLGMAVACLLRIRSWNKQRIVQLALTAAVVLLLGACYWLPLLEQLTTGHFHFMDPWTTPARQVLTLQQILPGGTHDLGLVPWVLLLCLPIALALGKQARRAVRCLAIGTVLLFLPVCKPFWIVMGGLLGFLQFPWRLYLYAMVFLTAGAGMTVGMLLQRAAVQSNLRPGKTSATSAYRFTAIVLPCLMVILFALSALPYLQERLAFQAGNELLDVYAYSVSNGGGEEWEPDQLSSNDLDRASCTTVYAQDGTALQAEKKGSRLTVSAAPAQFPLLLPYVYYKGYSAATQPSGSLVLTKDPATKLVLASLPLQHHCAGGATCADGIAQADSIIVTVAYTGTFLQHLSYAVSLISWLTLLLCLAIRRAVCTK